MFVIILLLCVIIYMLPTLIAYARDIPSRQTVTVVNIIFGWTLIGWFICLPVGDAGGDQRRRAGLTGAPMAGINAASRIPVTVLTGFLGSGKTTLLNHVLKQPDMAATAVIVNEFGEIGLDHLLVESATEDVVLMSSGCLCCTVRGDIANTLTDLFVGRVKGKVPYFTRAVIETTGLADPAPVLHALLADPIVAERYMIDGVVTTVDAVNGAGTLDRQIEAVKQAAVADRLIVTKTDLGEPDALAALEARLADAQPGRAAAAGGARRDRSRPRCSGSACSTRRRKASRCGAGCRTRRWRRSDDPTSQPRSSSSRR